MAFLTIEGLDGSGKSTQVDLLLAFLNEQKIPYVYTREPGGTGTAEQIRDVLLTTQNRGMSAMTEALLFAAARCENVEKVVRPALASGKLVVCDRYIDSSLVYQGYAGELPLELVRSINSHATGNLMSDRTILFDITPEAAQARRQNSGLGEDRIEEKTLSFHRTVREGYLALADAEPNRIVRIDANRAADQVHNDVRRVVLALLKAN